MVELQLIFAHSFLFICIWLRGSPLLRGFSSNCHEWGCSLVAVLGLLVAEYRLWGAQTPVARGLRSRSSRALGAGFSSCGARALGCTDPGSCGTRAPQSQLPGSRCRLQQSRSTGSGVHRPRQLWHAGSAVAAPGL